MIKNNLCTAVAGLLLLTSAFFAQTDATRTNGTTEKTAVEGKPPAFDLDQFQFAILRRGPGRETLPAAELEKLQAGHMANIQQMARLGKLMAAGPLGKNDAGLAGIFIFKAASIAEARALAVDDPLLKSERLTIDFFTWMGPKGLGVKFNAAFRQDEKTPATMTKYYLALLKKGSGWTAESTPETRQLQLGHLRHIRQMLDAKTYMAAGPAGGNTDLLGLLVIAAKSPAEARTAAEADPMVRAGRHQVEYFEWYCAKEVWP
ncbi:MAG: YciI family protein [Blastocatellia bacterium]